ncbi:TetR/AcrR family transcriptional regulator [Rhodococcoides fascians]|uniref:TetR/AcrR family transcriptional regulator n=1 Tax=Rhodococcoides fascians TaxID=1828 RepID=UPI00068F5E84|nr:TetR/AcrR family transcriptional regulator [Rhodococcus fascians]
MTMRRDEDEPRVDGRTLRHRHRRPELLLALTEYLLEFGIGDLSLRPAAAAIGVTHATLLRHFSTKDELIDEVVEQVVADIANHVVDDARGDGAIDLSDFLYSQWIRVTTDAARRQFLLLFELTARYGRDPLHNAALGGSLSDKLIEPLCAALRDRFTMSEDAVTDLAVMTIAQVRGLAVDIYLTDDRRRADRAMRAFVDRLAGYDLSPPAQPLPD